MRKWALEVLEARSLLAIFWVTSAGDSGVGSLRQAIEDINAASGGTISFQIGQEGRQRIELHSPLPPIRARNVIINGATQPAPAGAPPITLDGGRAGAGASGLVLEGDNIAVRGLSIVGFRGDGIRVLSRSNTIGGTTAAESNLISSNGGNGITLEASSTATIILGNYIGTDAVGSDDRGNGGFGVLVQGSAHTIGAVAVAERNVISGNVAGGLLIRGSVTAVNNFIGVDRSGQSPVGNGGPAGIVIESGVAVIGGPSRNQGNVISGNRKAGISLIGAGAGATIQNNWIGTDADGIDAVPNLEDGIRIAGSTRCDILDNVISGNQRNGIHVQPVGGGTAQGVFIAGNLIGTRASGTSALGNRGAGVRVDGARGTEIRENVISANVVGVEIRGAADATLVYANRIGTKADGRSPLGNFTQGIRVTDAATGTRIGGPSNYSQPGGLGNTIAHNGGAGIAVDAVVAPHLPGTLIQRNAIEGNGGLGIDLGGGGVTPNDASDADGGANDLLNFPELTEARSMNGRTRVRGIYRGIGGLALVLEFYENVLPDHSGHGEGSRYLGHITLTSSVVGTSFEADLDVQTTLGRFITAVAVEPVRGLTSEFSRAKEILRDPPPTVEIRPVDPDLTNQPVGSIQLVFSEPVNGLDQEDLTLRHDGVLIDLGPASLTESADGLTWTLSGLAGLTQADGHYELALHAAGSGIVDETGNPLAGGDAIDWLMDTIAPAATIDPVAPDPARSPNDQLTLRFSEPVSGFGMEDLALTRDGEPVSLASATLNAVGTDRRVWTLSGLASFATTPGRYALILEAAGSEIRDDAGNEMVSDATEEWVFNLAPTLTIQAVDRSPRNQPVERIILEFSEPIVGLDRGDLRLTRNGLLVSLADATLVNTPAGSPRWVLENLDAVTSSDGLYELVLEAAASGIADELDDPLVGTFRTSWVMDTKVPIASFDPVPPLRRASLASATLRFDEPVVGLTLGDIRLTRDGASVPLSSFGPHSPDGGTTWNIPLGEDATGPQGEYRLELLEGAGATDVAGNSLEGTPELCWTTDYLPVLGWEVEGPPRRNTPVLAALARFSEPITGFGVEDLILRRDGQAVGLPGDIDIEPIDARTYRVNLAPWITVSEGSYELILADAQERIADLQGNPLEPSAAWAWQMDTTRPRLVAIGPIDPDLRVQPVGQLRFQFDEPVLGLRIEGLTLWRDSVIVDLRAGGGLPPVTLTPDRQGMSWTLDGLDGRTVASGSYRLKLNGAGMPISDLAGNALDLASSVLSEGWIMDRDGPRLRDVMGIPPGMIDRAIDSLVIHLSEAVDVEVLRGAISLHRDGGRNLLGAAQPLMPEGSSPTRFRLSGLASLTNVEGSYEFRVDQSSLRDPIGNPGSGAFQAGWDVDLSPPESAVEALPELSRKRQIPVRWSGRDRLSSVSNYDVYVSKDGGPWELWMAGTTATSALYTGEIQHSYAFATAAADSFGHREALPPPDRPEAATRLDPPVVWSMQRAKLTAAETDRSISLVITRSGGLHGPATVRLRDLPGSARPGINYMPIDVLVKFKPDEMSRTVTLPLKRDRLSTADLRLTVLLEAIEEGTVIGDIPRSTIVIRNTDPRIVNVASFRPIAGRDGLVSRIVLDFTGPLDRASARAIGNYALTSLRKTGAVPVPLRDASLGRGGKQVVLRLKTPVRFDTRMQLRILGSRKAGLKGSDGHCLDGNGDGRAGGHAMLDFEPAVSRRRRSR